MPMPPQPAPYSYHNSDNNPDDPGVVEENFSAKEAGAQSFAHYIINWVSARNKLLLVQLIIQGQLSFLSHFC